jgi:DNA-binding transcriptional ArsR family regulator
MPIGAERGDRDLEADHIPGKAAMKEQAATADVLQPSLDRARAERRHLATTPLDWEHIARKLVHPARAAILELLAESPRAMSPSQLAPKLGISVELTAYHFRALHKAELLVEISTRRVRGAVQHFYRLAG